MIEIRETALSRQRSLASFLSFISGELHTFQVNYTRTEAAAAEHGMSLLELRLGLSKVGSLQCKF